MQTTGRHAQTRPKLAILAHLMVAVLLACARTGVAQEKSTARSSPIPPIIKQSAEGLPREQAGTAVVERLGKVFVDVQGPHAAVRAGDWRLANEKVELFFAGVDDALTSDSMPLAGYHDVLMPANRTAGALIDVALPERALDFFAFFTQGVGTRAFGDKVIYDTIEPVERDGAVGLQMEGSPFDNALVRLRTTYWLKPGESRVAIESRLLDADPGLPLPELSDMGQFYSGAFVIEGGDLLARGQDTPISGKYYAVNGDVYTAALAPSTGTLEGVFSHQEGIARTKLDAETSATLAQLPAAAEGDGILLTRRNLWLGAGMFDTVMTPIHESRGEELGILEGKLIGPEDLGQAARRFVTFFKVGISSVDEKTGVPIGDGTMPTLFTITQVADDGTYRVELPPGFYNPTPEFNIDPRRAYAGIHRVVANQITKRDFQIINPAGVKLTVLDDATSRPLEARLRIEPIAPTEPVNFGMDVDRMATLNSVYVPREGRLLPLLPGNYLFYVTHGPRYQQTEVMIKVEPKQVADQVIRLKEVVPTPGWIGIEMGARTTATPGCAITPEAYVRMAAAEGLDWIISGDYETVTDFEPVIKELGLENELRSSRGFRTLNPAHPEWGHLFVYPLAADAPDPARARAQWADTKTSQEWIAAVRKAYPDAIVQVDVPWTRAGRGYFSRGETNVYVIAHTPAEDAETAVDALNIIPARSAWYYDQVMALWYNHMIAGRKYIASTAPLARHPFGGEPGYPRVLAKVDGALAEINESDLFKAVRQGHTQLTNGPFIQWGGSGLEPGQLIPLQSDPELKLRVTSTNWIVPSQISVDKEGVPQVTEILHLEPDEYQRFPPPGEGLEVKTYRFRTLRLNERKDTLLGVTATGNSTPLNDGLPAYSPAINNFPFATITPFIIDANGNNAYDPLEHYPQRGQ